MLHDSQSEHVPKVGARPRIQTPEPVRPTFEEIERRRLIVERIIERHDRVGPIGIRADDLLYQAELEAEQ